MIDTIESWVNEFNVRVRDCNTRRDVEKAFTDVVQEAQTAILIALVSDLQHARDEAINDLQEVNDLIPLVLDRQREMIVNEGMNFEDSVHAAYNEFYNQIPHLGDWDDRVWDALENADRRGK